MCVQHENVSRHTNLSFYMLGVDFTHCIDCYLLLRSECVF